MLIAYCAGCLARGLAGSLAFTAAARCHGILENRVIDRLDVLHSVLLANKPVRNYTIRLYKIQTVLYHSGRAADENEQCQRHR